MIMAVQQEGFDAVQYLVRLVILEAHNAVVAVIHIHELL